MKEDVPQSWREQLKPLFSEAIKKGLWFYSPYHSFWCSPEELRDFHKQGRFRWGAANWRLRDPKERITELEKEIKIKEAQLEDFKKRVKGGHHA